MVLKTLRQHISEIYKGLFPFSGTRVAVYFTFRSLSVPDIDKNLFFVFITVSAHIAYMHRNEYIKLLCVVYRVSHFLKFF